MSTAGGEWTVEFERSVVDVTSNAPEPDLSWVHVDAAGHEHRWVDGQLPSLVSVSDGAYWCPDCEDEHEDSHLECPLCRETVTPGMVGPSGWRRFIPGPASVRVIHDDGRVRREFVVMTAEDMQGLKDDPAATLARIAATQEPVSVESYGL